MKHHQYFMVQVGLRGFQVYPILDLRASVDSTETGSAVVINDYWVWYGGPSCEEVSSHVGVE